MQVQSLRDALDVINYLKARGILCYGCGWRIATQEHQFYKHCEDCVTPHGRYSPLATKVTSFETAIGNSLGEWVSTVEAQGDWKAPGGTSAVQGEGKT